MCARWTLLLSLFACSVDIVETTTTAPRLTDTGTPPTSFEPTIEVFPTNVTFSEVTPNCTVSQEVEVRNTGNYPLEILDYEWIAGTASTFSFDGRPATIPPDNVVTLTIDYTPTEAQSEDQATLRITSDDPYNWKVDIEIEATSGTDEPVVETFEQKDAGPVDILLVLDDDPALADRLTALSEQVENMVSWFNDAGILAHIGVLDGDMTSPDRGGALIGDYVDVTQTSAADALVDAMLQTTGGAADHRYFDVIQAALSEPLSSTANMGFKRDGAPLEIVAYSISDDSSSLNAVGLANWLDTLPSAPAARFSAISGPTSGLLPCGAFSALPVSPAPRLGNAIAQTGGTHWLFCDVGADKIASELPPTVSDMQTEWALSQLVTTPEWIYVTVNGEEIDRDNANGWSFVSATNSIRFGGAAIPLPNSEIQIAYPARRDCSD